MTGETTPVFSVVIPAYNARRHIVESVESALSQTCTSIEVIVVDDGSKDDTHVELSAINDSRLRVIRKANEGCAVARNTGFDAARGEFVSFLDADDRWRTTKLTHELEVFRAHPAIGLVISNLERFTPSGALPRTQFSYCPEMHRVTIASSSVAGVRVTELEGLGAILSLGQPPWHPSGVSVRRTVASGVRFRPQLEMVGEDVAFVLEVAARTNVGFLEAVQVEYRLHETSATGGKAPIERVRDGLGALDIVRSELPSRKQQAAIDRRIGAELAGMGHHYFWNRKWGEAARTYGRSLRYPGARMTAIKHLAALPVMALLPSRR